MWHTKVLSSSYYCATLSDMSSKVISDTLRGTARRFTQFQGEYASFFQTKTRDSSEVAGHYLNGLVQATKSNMGKMEERVPESNGQALQHFITNSPWDERAVLAKVAKDGDALLGGNHDSCLLIDETSFAKKGPKSVGVARQWTGRYGKIDNCQVAVFGALVSDKKSLPIDFSLYLPKEWTDDPKRCDAAGIPQDKRELKSKCELAIEIVKRARDNGVRFNWVGADAGYGKDPGFLGDLFAMGETFMCDVHKSQYVYLVDPHDAPSKPMTVEKWTAQQAEESWQTHTLRDTTKGPLKSDHLHGRFWIKAESGKVNKRTEYRQVHLLVRRSHETKDDLSYAVSNASEDTPTQRLAFMQCQRFWIERAFEDSKGNLGMAEYQLRKWRGWHHHMALVAMAHLFLLKEKIHNAETLPLLSMQDVVTMLAFYLPKRDTTEEEVFRQLETRHRNRQRDIDRVRH